MLSPVEPHCRSMLSHLRLVLSLCLVAVLVFSAVPALAIVLATTVAGALHLAFRKQARA